jgi:hypothetical protein
MTREDCALTGVRKLAAAMSAAASVRMRFMKPF